MDPEDVLRALEGYQDELTPLKQEQTDFYRQFSCPRCSCSLSEDYDPRTAFTGDAVIPKAVLVCPNCEYTIDPHTGVIVRFGDASKIPVETIPIIGGDYLP